MQLTSRGVSLDLTYPQVMGILNVTPDSFSDGGRHNRIDLALKHAQAMIAAGATILDIGGESTRPGAAEVSEDEELSRVVPVVDAISQRMEVWISVNTSKAAVIRETAKAGAHLINDIRSLQEPGALSAAAASGVPVCLMDMQGQPNTMQHYTSYYHSSYEVATSFREKFARCMSAGIFKSQLWLDPGFGLGKNL